MSGLIFGYLGDKTGRKKWLVISLLLMGLATVLIGCLPSYQQIGLAAPVLLIFLRLLQGIALGGDFPGGITFVTEHSHPKHRGFNCAIIFLFVNVGLLLASLVSAVITSLCTPVELLNWGWRIGFWFSALLVFAGIYLRRNLSESSLFLQSVENQELERNPALFIIDVLSALLISTIPVLLSELFKTPQRYSGVAFTYNIGFSIIGGLAPLTVLLLGQIFINSALISLNIIIMALICFVFALFNKRISQSMF